MGLTQKVVFGAIILGIASVCGCYGVRGQKDIYSFEYRGQPAAIVEQDVRWGPNVMFIRLREGERFEKGTLLTDDGKKISINENIFYGRYSIRDAESRSEE